MSRPLRSYDAATRRALLVFAAAAGTGIAFMPAISAARPGALADAPLFLTQPVEPNVLFVLDDSGSMGWGLMTSERDGVMNLGCPYQYTHPTGAGTAIVPTEEALQLLSVAEPFGGVWRAWNSSYNRIYYNPDITYVPWSGTSPSGAPYANINPAAAPLDPASPAQTLDLTAPLSYTTDYCAGNLPVLVEAFQPARYYTWSDSDADGTVDATDDRELVQISPATVTYYGSERRTDCAAAPICTYAEEIGNFANWFSYYRSRELSAKAAYGQMIATVNNARMGLISLHDNNSVNTAITEMNPEADSGARAALLNALYSIESTGNTPLRATLDNAGRYLGCSANDVFGSCPALPSDAGGECQQNFTILMTDGFYNGSFGGIGNADGNNDSLWDSGPDGPYGDTNADTLGDIAMHYYETDLRPGVANDLSPPPGGLDENTAQHMVTFSVAYGVQGTINAMPPNRSDPFAWPAPTSDQAKIDDLRHAAWNGRGDYFGAQDTQELVVGLRSSLQSIQGRAGSSASVAFNTGALSRDTDVFLAMFDSERWSGDLLSFPLDPHTGDIGVTPNWSAAAQLDARNLASSPRTILTYDGTEGTAFRWAQLTVSQRDDLRTLPSGAQGDDAAAQARVGYVRGDRNCEVGSAGVCSYADAAVTFDDKIFRLRDSRLGDFVQSGPVYAGVPESNWPDVSPFPGTAGDTYTDFRNAQASRRGVVWLGGNDGMLHGFDAESGAEIMAYVPNALYSTAPANGLHYLADPGYTHRYGVDLTPTIADAYVRTTTSGSNGWKTILVGGLRGGGRGLFALDVTDPEVFSESGSAPANTVMWEFSSDDDPDLGHTFSRPSIVPLRGSGGSIRWAAVVGNGYNDEGSGQAKLFILFLEGGLDGTWSAGTDYIEISTGRGDTVDRNGLSTPAVVDSDGDSFADRAYAGDLYGNVWAFDLSGSNTGNWAVAFGASGAREPLFTAPAGQQVTSTPVVVRHPELPTSGSNVPNLLVMFGTGQYLTAADITTTGVQAMYGVRDTGAGSLSQAQLTDQSIGIGWTSEGVMGRTLTDYPVNYATSQGWYMNLPDVGERVISDPVVRDDLVYFNTMIPDSNPCNFGGRGWLMIAKIVNGGRPDAVRFDLNNDNLLDNLDTIGGEAAVGTAITGIATTPVNLADRRYTSTTETTGASSIEVTDIAQIDSRKTGRLSWEELTP